jgi:hypothetical protein
VRLWTVSAQTGVAGLEIVAGLVGRAGASLYHCDTFGLSAGARAVSRVAAAERAARGTHPGLAHRRSRGAHDS